MALHQATEGGFTNHIGPMLQTHPGKPSLDRTALQAAIAAVLDCAQACTACADACIAEKEAQKLFRCIALNLDCASVCEATGKLLSRQTVFEPQLARAMLQACMLACRLCGDECGHHAQLMEHCRICAEVCRRCEYACSQLLATASS